MSHRKTATILSLAFAGVMVSGCASTAPLWPEGGVAQAPPNYGRPDRDCAGLECVRRRVRDRFDAYVASRAQIADYRNAANLALFGIGGAAGVNAVTKGSKEGLQTLALTAAGIVGLDGVIKADDQYEAFTAGQEALQCVMDLDREQDNALNALQLPSLAPEPSESEDRPRSESAAAASTERGVTNEAKALGPYLGIAAITIPPHERIKPTSETVAPGAGSSGAVSQFLTKVADGRGALETALSRSLGRKLTSVADGDLITIAAARQAELNDTESRIRDALGFRLQVTNLAAYDKRADELNHALNDITTAVSGRLLFTHKDLSAIYAALKGAMEKAAKPPQQGQTPTPTGAPTGDKPATSTASISNLKQNGVADVQAVVLFQQAAEQAGQDAQKVARYTEVYKSCLEMAEKKAGNQGGGAGGGTGGTGGGIGG